ncbi:MAG: DNA repair protein RadA [Negativicutes bacterium]|jgi:DNA repair protein RadA/Sms
MSKIKTQFFCNECGYESGKWLGRCPGCSAWNSLSEEVIAKNSKRERNANSAKVVNIIDVSAHEDARIMCGLAEFDKVLGGGIVGGSLSLLGGDPGIGKSTLAMQIAMRLSLRDVTVLYVSGEESAQQIKLRAKRLGDCGKKLLLFTATDIDEILLVAEQHQPQLLIIDSIQTMFDQNISSAPGSVSQVRECAGRMLRFAKERNIAVVIIGHITKDGQIAGPKILEHMVDVVLYFEGEQNNNFRILRAKKNRFGGINECGIFSMRTEGLVEVLNPSAILLNDRSVAHPGAVITPFMQGNRPLLLEVQALACQSYYGMPRRLVSGYDYNRLIMLLAVLERRAGLLFGQQDVFLNVIGGIKIDETAADLAAAIAIVSSLRNTAVGNDVCAFGEISLTGEIRSVMNVEERVKEAEALGFKTIILPKSCLSVVKKSSKIKIVGVDDIHAVMDLI